MELQSTIGRRFQLCVICYSRIKWAVEMMKQQLHHHNKMFKEKVEIRLLHTEQELHAASKLLTEAFVNLNNIWKTMEPDYQDVYDIFYYKMFESLRQFMAYGFYVDGVMVGATGNYPLEYYLSMSGKPTKSKLFDYLAKYGQKVEEVFPSFHHRNGDAVYGAFAAMAPEHSFKGYSLWFWIEGFKLMQTVGYKTYYSRMSSPVSLLLLKKIGAEQVNSIEMEQEEVKGQKLTLIRLDLTKKLPEFHELKKSMMTAKL